MRIRSVVTFTTVSLVLTTLNVAAIVTPLTRADMERATGLARWPRSDADRARFHRPYVVSLTGVGTDFFAIKTVEVITEFRRLELIAEAHARLNDNFARAGVREAEEAIGPWKGFVWVVARLDLTNHNRYVRDTPDVDIVIGGQKPIAPANARVIGVNGSEGELIGWTVEAAFPAALLRSVACRFSFDSMAAS